MKKNDKTISQYSIQGKFRPHFIFALWREGKFKTGQIELNVKYRCL